MARDPQERSGTNGAWPGLAVSHPSGITNGDQLGKHQDGGNGAEGRQKE